MTPPDRGGARRWLQLAVGIAISALLIWFGFREQSFTEIWQHVTAMQALPMVIAVGLATLSFPLRVPRWKLLLRQDDGEPVENAALWHAITIGFAGNNVLPFRLGEVVRIGTVARLGRVPFSAALSSVAIERVLDGLMVLGLLGAGFVLADLPVDSAIASKATLIGVVFLVALVAAFAMAWRPSLPLGIAARLLPAGRVRDGVTGILGRVLHGLGALRDPRRAAPVFGWTLLLWIVNAAGFWFAFKAFGIEVPFAGALIVQGMLVIGIALPSSPGYVGVFEAGIWFPLESFFGIPKEVGFACALTFHVLSFIPITLLGAWSLVRTGLSVRSAREAAG